MTWLVVAGLLVSWVMKFAASIMNVGVSLPCGIFALLRWLFACHVVPAVSRQAWHMQRGVQIAATQASIAAGCRHSRGARPTGSGLL